MMRLFRRYVVVLSSLLIFAAGASLPAQVSPSGTMRQLPYTVGGLGSVFQPEYGGGNIGQSGASGKLGEAGPKPLYGVAAYLDVDVSHWVQIEAEARWSAFHTYRGIKEDNYLIGPRVPVYRFRQATAYAKVLFGTGNGDFLSSSKFAIVYGGGLDYRLSDRFTIRAIDFEYQQWRTSPTFFPYGGSAGVGFNF